MNDYDPVLDSEEFESEEMEAGMYVNVSPSQLLKSIVISPEAPVWFRRLVRGVVQDYDLDVPIQRSRLDSKPI